MIIDKKEKHQVHSDEMKLRILMKKVKAEFLGNAKTTLQLKFLEVPITFTYENAIQLFRNVVNTTHLKKVSTKTNVRRGMSEVSTSHGRFGSRGTRQHEQIQGTWIRGTR